MSRGLCATIRGPYQDKSDRVAVCCHALSAVRFVGTCQRKRGAQQQSGITAPCTAAHRAVVADQEGRRRSVAGEEELGRLGLPGRIESNPAVRALRNLVAGPTVTGHFDDTAPENTRNHGLLTLNHIWRKQLDASGSAPFTRRWCWVRVLRGPLCPRSSCRPRPSPDCVASHSHPWRRSGH